MRKLPALCFLAVWLLITSVSGAVAQPGSPDTTFGRDGRVVTDFGSPAVSRAIAIQSDGKIVVAGRIGRFRIGGVPSELRDFAVARYRPNGSLDPTFGRDGVIRTDVTGKIDAATQILIQPDGMIIVAGIGGQSAAFEPISNFALVRYAPDGTLDEGFGTDGKVTTDFGFRDGIQAVALQPDGKIVAAGYSFDDLGDGAIALAFARYNGDGSLDATFGTGGKVVTVGGQVLAVSVQPDGKILAAGAACCDSGGGEFLVLARYSSGGSLDTSFGDNGIVKTPAGAFSFYGSMIFAPDGSIFASGFSRFSNPKCLSNGFSVAHFTADGGLDASFGHHGVVITIISCSSYAKAVTVQPDGKVVATGFAFPGDEGVFAVVRYNTDGSRDQTFGRHGKVTTHFDQVNAAATALAIDADGRAVAAGVADRDFALARYLG
jgi:uncharacterized delta-60 repeat protein